MSDWQQFLFLWQMSLLLCTDHFMKLPSAQNNVIEMIEPSIVSGFLSLKKFTVIQKPCHRILTAVA
jgi:hypothetical protein